MPFAYAVGMLCYRIGYGVLQSGLLDAPTKSRELFTGTITLLDQVTNNVRLTLLHK